MNFDALIDDLMAVAFPDPNKGPHGDKRRQFENVVNEYLRTNVLRIESMERVTGEMLTGVKDLGDFLDYLRKCQAAKIGATLLKEKHLALGEKDLTLGNGKIDLRIFTARLNLWKGSVPASVITHEVEGKQA